MMSMWGFWKEAIVAYFKALETLLSYSRLPIIRGRINLSLSGLNEN
jgi:hypothetical protein